MLVIRIGLACIIPMVSTPSWAQEAGDPGRGLVFAQQTCASCHAVLPAETTSPRPNTATFKTIANTPGMTGTAVAVWLQTPHKSMPDLIIEAGDRNDVIAYILSLRVGPGRK
jgi:mono/diheme cytochrome c family protein